MMTSREVVIRAVKFQCPDRLPLSLPEPYGNDFAGVSMNPHPDARPANGPDEWGAVWKNIGVCRLGEVQEYPLKDWSDFDSLSIPDIKDPARWTCLEGIRETAGDKFLLGGGISLYERVHFIRGLENTWADIYTNPDDLRKLIDILVDMNIEAVKRYSDAGCDGLFWCDDWGLQDRLMISPEKWREIWKPAYARVYQASHEAGMLNLLHSCGHIVHIMDDLIEIGLDVIQMDQQENMGLELLSERFAGRITFWCPVDIQNTMCQGSLEDIKAYARKMVKLLGRKDGGFITQWYADPVGAGHTQEAIDAMCDEFLKISVEMYG